MHLGDLPAWFAWIATVGVLIVALIQIRTERRIRHATEEQEREERHFAQARLVSAILGPEESAPEAPGTGRTAVDLVNGSAEPVYTLVVGIVFIQGAGPTTIEEQLQLRQQNPGQPVPVTTASLLPGGGGIFRVWMDGVGWSSIMAGRWAADVAFTDRAGSHWIRRATGKLDELPEGPLDYFHRWEMPGPYELQKPKRVE